MNNEFIKHLTDAVQTFYEEYGAVFSRTRSYAWNEEKYAATFVKPGMTVVDVGAGNGKFASALPSGVTYIGIEPSSTFRASAPPDLDLRPGALPSLPIDDATADVTTCFAVFHHIPTREGRQAAVQELIRITKPEGLIIASSWHLPHILPLAKGELEGVRSDSAHTSPHPSFARRGIRVKNGEPGDVWVPWKADGATAQRFVHLMQPGEWKNLWLNDALQIEQIGLFGKDDWTQNIDEARNWLVMGRKK